MKIIVKAKAGAREEAVEKLTQPTLGLEGKRAELDVYKVSVREPAVDGRANNAIVKALANYFGIARSHIRLVSGQTSKRKVFEIEIEFKAEV